MKRYKLGQSSTEKQVIVGITAGKGHFKFITETRLADKPCPFCSKTNTVSMGVGRYVKTCMSCGANTSSNKSAEAATELWNQRAKSDKFSCPFCGHVETDIAQYDHNHYGISCLSCRSVGPIKSSFTNADKAWQRRM